MAVHHRNRDFNLKSREIIFEFSSFSRDRIFFRVVCVVRENEDEIVDLKLLSRLLL